MVVNASLTDSMLKKKINSIAYQFVREGSVKNEWRYVKVGIDDNPLDLMTK